MNYCIGGHNIKVTTYLGDDVLERLLPSFAPFETEDSSELLFSLEVCETLKETDEADCRMVRDVDTGNGITRVCKLTDGGYMFRVNDVSEHECAIILCDAAFRECRCSINGGLAIARFALNNTLMLIYAFSGAKKNTLLVHASVVRHNGVAYAFTAKSGTGKSTQVANWLRHIEGCDMINDDNPIFRLTDDGVMLYGSPWSGKTPCYRNIMVPLGALMLIKRDGRNYVKKQQPIVAFSTLLTACSAMKWDEELFQMVCSTVSKIVEKTTIAELHCLPNAESAMVCKEFLEG